MAEIKLLYFPGCPNVDDARGNLRQALAGAGLPPQWREIDVAAPDAPRELRGFPSPTVLVDDRDISGGSAGPSGEPSCRFGGAPSAAAIAESLRGHKTGWAGLAALPAAALGALPAAACPACFPALAALLSALGVSATAVEAGLRPLMAGLLSIALAGLAYQAARTRRFGPAVLGLFAALGIYLGLFVFESGVLRWASVALLSGASLWNALPSLRRLKPTACGACQEGRG